MRWQRWHLGGTLSLVLGVAGCASDVVPPDNDTEPECGNGVLESGEQCDLASDGCHDCAVVPGWTCDGTSCAPICGDGVVGGGATCEGAARDSDCDLTGYWAVRESVYTRDTVVNALQTSSTWHLFHLEQTGNALIVAEHLECGFHVTGSVTVDPTAGTLRALTTRNRMDKESKHGARKGTSIAVTNGCDVSFERWYKVLGGSEETLLPADFAAHTPLADLPPLPKVDDPVKATTFPPEAEDWDGDGIGGVGFRISGFAQGVRSEVQRDYREFATNAPIPPRALTFTIPGNYDLQGSVIKATQCGGLCSLLVSPANAARDVLSRVTLSFIGKTLDGVRTRGIIAGVPRKSLDTDLATCARIRAMLPHDTTKPTPVPKGT